jgi:hypothetical protein
MGSPVPLRDGFDATDRRSLARRSGAAVAGLATIYDGGLRGDAAQISSVDLQTVRDWVPY